MRLLILIMLSLSLSALAVDSAEEALLLNQELQLLEDSTKINPITETRSINTAVNESPRTEKSNLEEKYFGSDTDQIKTRTAAPRRRGSY